ncbi:hypothetical protein HDV03_001599 [Kappamyces sp. JEL0829]|nr:hypothetical protein HDV03_001599 [Kappamyces sp. JEL0829]
MDPGAHSEDDVELLFVHGDELFEYDNSVPPLSLSKSLHRSEVELDKVVGFWSGLSLIIGGIIGSGIFASPGPVLLDVESVGASLCIWVIAGIIAMMGGLCYSELGTMIPESGGDHPYLLRAYGQLPAFLFSWTNVLASRPGSIAIIVTTCAEYLARLLVPSTPSNSMLAKALGIAILSLLTLVNALSNRAATSVQTVMTAGKLLALTLIGTIGLYYLVAGQVSSNFDHPIFTGSSSNPGSYALAFYSALWAYDGWNALNAVAGELKDPEKALPLSIIVGTAMVIVVYFTTNLAYYVVLPKSIIATSTTIALDFGEAVFGIWGKGLFAVAVIISTIGAANGNIFGGARISFVSSQKGHAPSFLGAINKATRTPLNALLLQASFTAMLILIGSFKKLVNIYSIIIWIWYFLTVLGLLIMRLTEPFAVRPFKVWTVVPIAFCCK